MGFSSGLRAAHIAGTWGLLFLTGCPSLEKLPSQRPVEELTLEGSDRDYLLYVPSNYDRGRAWPLVILCHGTRPYDTPELQMREWASFAEGQGIIVAAPDLVGTRGDFPPSPARQIALQIEDEQAILEIVTVLKQRYRIAEERVFMAGWSGGAYAIFHTGVRHPEVFRALFVRQGTFDERYMDVPEESFDRWQGIKITFGQSDLLRDQAKAAVAWLRAHKMYVEELETSGAHRRTEASDVWSYFKDVAKNRLWVRIRTVVPDLDAPLTIRFAADCIPAAAKHKWYFGDGDESYEADPTHTYAKAGRYDVTVNVSLANRKKYARTRTIFVGPFAE